MSKIEITALILIALLVIAGLAGIVLSHESVDPNESPRAKPAPRASSPMDAGPRIGTASAGGGSGRMSTRQSLEYRLRLYDSSGVLQQGKIIHSIKQGLQEYEPALLRILEEETGSLIMPAVEIAGRLESGSPLSLLYSLCEASDPRLRAKAIEAISNRRMWEKISLRQLLQREKDPDVLTAALRAAALVEDAPLDGMLPLLGHDEWRVVRAAQAAMPDEMDEEALELLNEFIAGSPPGTAVIAIQVLGGLEASELRNQSILKHLNGKSWAVKSASLRVLISSGGKIDDPEPIWKVIDDPTVKVRLRVLAFLALEVTQSVKESRYIDVIGSLHPVAKLAAARGLIVNKNREGIRVLIDLLDTKKSRTVTADDRACAIHCAHEILQEIAHRVIEPKSRLWLPWYRRNEPLPGTPLEAIPKLTW